MTHRATKILTGSFLAFAVALLSAACIISATIEIASAKSRNIQVEKYEDENLIYLEWGDVEDMAGYTLSIGTDETTMGNCIPKMGFTKSFRGTHVKLQLLLTSGAKITIYDDEL